MVIACLVVMAYKSESHRCPMEMSEWVRCGKISTWRAARGRLGRFSSPVCVDTTLSPLGREMVMDFAVGVTLMRYWVSIKA